MHEFKTSRSRILPQQTWCTSICNAYQKTWNVEAGFAKHNMTSLEFLQGTQRIKQYSFEWPQYFVIIWKPVLVQDSILDSLFKKKNFRNKFNWLYREVTPAENLIYFLHSFVKKSFLIYPLKFIHNTNIQWCFETN